MSDPSVVREIDPVIVPIVDDEPLVSMDEWMRSLRRPGPPRALSRATYEFLYEASGDAK